MITLCKSEDLYGPINQGKYSNVTLNYSFVLIDYVQI